MSLIDHCYLRSLRREWGFTQEEVAALVKQGGRNRVSRIERGVAPPNAREILAYGLIFGSPPIIIFPRFHAETMEVVVGAARHLHKRLGPDPSALAASKRKLLERIFAEANDGTKSLKP